MARRASDQLADPAPSSLPKQLNQALRQLAAWPLRVAQIRSLFSDAWRHRHNLTFADATYVALAEHLDAALLTDDHKLAGAPNAARPNTAAPDQPLIDRRSRPVDGGRSP